MTDSTPREAKCLCGTVQFSLPADQDKVGACHCNMCRKWSGGPFFAIHVAGGLTFEGQEAITVFDSSEWAERGFCSRCGSHLFYRLKQNGDVYIPPGLLENQDGLTFESQVFIDEKPCYYTFTNETSNLTGPELFAMFGAQE